MHEVPRMKFAINGTQISLSLSNYSSNALFNNSITAMFGEFVLMDIAPGLLR
jgi:hypothetical protein